MNIFQSVIIAKLNNMDKREYLSLLHSNKEYFKIDDFDFKVLGAILGLIVLNELLASPRPK